jgi:hypothetical protein
MIIFKDYLVYILLRKTEIRAEQFSLSSVLENRVIALVQCLE